MFYLTHEHQDEEARQLRSASEIDARGPDLPALTANTRVHLRGQCVGPACDGAILWMDPATACWCVFEGEEPAIASTLAETRSWGGVATSAGPAKARALRRLLGHCWRAGFLEVGGSTRWPPALFERGPVFRRSHLVEIHLTSRCNLRCRYCFAEAGSDGADLPDDLAHEAVDLALALPSDDLTIEFAGGEPLLRFDLLRALIRQKSVALARRPRAVGIALQTNGLLLQGEVLRYFADRPRISVGVSLDRPERIHDQARVGPAAPATMPHRRRRPERLAGARQAGGRARGSACRVVVAAGRGRRVLRVAGPGQDALQRDGRARPRRHRRSRARHRPGAVPPALCRACLTI